MFIKSKSGMKKSRPESLLRQKYMVGKLCPKISTCEKSISDIERLEPHRLTDFSGITLKRLEENQSYTCSKQDYILFKNEHIPLE